MLIFGMKDELDLLAGILLEGRDDFPDRLALLRIALIPPHDEIGGLGAERAHDQRHGENENSAAHQCLSSETCQCERSSEFGRRTLEATPGVGRNVMRVRARHSPRAPGRRRRSWLDRAAPVFLGCA